MCLLMRRWCPLRRRAQQSGARARAQAWVTLGAWVAMVLMVLAVQLASARPDDCALPLDPHGPSFNGLEGERCITWAAVEAAWAAGREKAGLRRPLKEAEGSGGPPLARALLGTALQEATRLLSERYGLSREEVRELLPRVDTRRTRVRDFCPAALASDQPCAVARFRRYDGRCNNLRHPTWGSAGAPFRRMAPPEYADGVSAPRASRAGFPLPNPRAVSAHVHRDGEHHESAVTLMFVAWGQLVDHDITLTAETKDPETRTDPECCGPGTERRHPNCLPVLIPPGDAFYRRHGQTCMNVLRSLAGAREDCRLGPRAQFNQMTSFIDAGFLYGSSEAEARRLRAGRGGRLQMQDAFGPLGLKELLPFKRDFPDEGCLRADRRRGPLCFLAGDNRANEQLVLTALHTALAREHNRLAEGLAHVNPHWGDERIFQVGHYFS
ncbi:hypothetical protein R5R35_003966 [Gryllus longicercus]|uniref:Peroxidase n=1 Tax=Gryllus longicercus TaxID=2509291 RepID=A0AAN9VYU8_9ORTH